MEDIRIGRKTGGHSFAVTVGATAVQLLPADKHRTSVLISPPAAGSVTITSDPGPTAGNGYLLASGGHPLQLRVELHGDTVTKELYAIADAGGRVVGGWTGSLPDE